MSAARMKTETADLLRVLIVDDEPLARELLRTMLASEDDVEIVGECGDGESAVDSILNLAPDLVFLDVQMPEFDGFGVLSRIPPDRLPAVIFATAFDHYAIRAFEVHALDYLLKPFDDERLASSLRHARLRLTRRESQDDVTERLRALLEGVQSRTRYLERIVVKEEGRIFFLPVESVDWFEADGKNIRVHVGPEAHTIRDGMYRLESELDPAAFLRVSRSAIVNIDRIRELRSGFQGDYLGVLRSGKQIPTTRMYREGIQGLLGTTRKGSGSGAVTGARRQ